MSKILMSATAIAFAALLSGCVNRSDYEELAGRYDNLKKEVEKIKETSSNEAKRAATLSDQLEASKLELQKSQAEFDALKKSLENLKTEYEGFKAKRRAAMVGKKYPELVLNNGSSLKDAEIVSFDLADVTFRHSAGILHVPLQNLSADICWEAVWTPADAEKAGRNRDASLQDGRAKLEASNMLNDVQRRSMELLNREKQIKELNALSSTLNISLKNQRKTLNDSFNELLKSTASSHLTNSSSAGTWKRGWNSSQPEMSPVLSDLSRMPAALGMSSLQTLRNDILATKKRITSVAQQIAQVTQSQEAAKSAKQIQDRIETMQAQLVYNRRNLNNQFESACKKTPELSSQRVKWNTDTPEASGLFADPSITNLSAADALFTTQRQIRRILADIATAKGELALTSR